jgi:hypothetical protein
VGLILDILYTESSAVHVSNMERDVTPIVPGPRSVLALPSSQHLTSPRWRYSFPRINQVVSKKCSLDRAVCPAWKAASQAPALLRTPARAPPACTMNPADNIRYFMNGQRDWQKARARPLSSNGTDWHKIRTSTVSACGKRSSSLKADAVHIRYPDLWRMSDRVFNNCRSRP